MRTVAAEDDDDDDFDRHRGTSPLVMLMMCWQGGTFQRDYHNHRHQDELHLLDTSTDTSCTTTDDGASKFDDSGIGRSTDDSVKNDEGSEQVNDPPAALQWVPHQPYSGFPISLAVGSPSARAISLSVLV